VLKMKKTLFKVFLLLVIIFIFLFSASTVWTVWDEYLSYYWHTKIITLYQSGEVFRLCDGVDPLLPIWTPNEDYYLHTKSAEKAVKAGLPITFVVRGAISDSAKEVYVEEIHEVIVGANDQCEK
jgi:hypothetical protein